MVKLTEHPIFKTFIAQNTEIWTEDFICNAYKLCTNTILQFEESFVELIFKISNKDVTARQIKQYIRYIADRRFMQFGLKEMYLIDTKPLSWLDEILSRKI